MPARVRVKVLKDRLISGLIMLAGFIVVNFWLPQWLFSFAVSLVVGVAAWEWSRLAGVVRRELQYTYAITTALAALIVGWLLPETLDKAVFLSALLLWFALTVLLVMDPVATPIQEKAHTGLLLCGLFLLIVCALALVRLHGGHSGSPWLLVYVLVVVWAMDIGAYFSGRRFGRHRLAPLISPGKTIEGVYGGLAAALLTLLLTLAFSPAARYAITAILIGSLLAAFFSVVGDLFESRLKRAAGAKDSSNLIKGHGGVLDRVDGVLAAAPAFAFAWYWL